MHRHTRTLLGPIVLAFVCMSSFAHPVDIQSEVVPSSEGSATSRPQAPATPAPKSGGVIPPLARKNLPDQAFTHPPEKPHDPAALLFTFDQLEHWYRVPGEFTRRLTGDEYGFETMSFIITETHPGGGPGLHVHDTEEAHVLLEGTAQYRIGDKTFTVQGPYVAKVPAGVPHTFINAGTMPFNLIAVFASKHPSTKRVGPNPLIPVPQNRDAPRPGPSGPTP